MNNLNSVLLEGVIFGDVERNSFCIQYRSGGEKFYFKVAIRKVMLESTIKQLSDGTGVRIVGSLAQKEDGSCLIIAEHLAIKPVYEIRSQIALELED